MKYYNLKLFVRSCVTSAGMMASIFGFFRHDVLVGSIGVMVLVAGLHALNKLDRDDKEYYENLN